MKILNDNGLVLKLKEVALGLDQKYGGPYRKINITAPDTYQLDLVSNPRKVTTTHTNKLKKYYFNDVCVENISEVNNNIEVLGEDIDIKRMSNQKTLSNIKKII